MTEIDSRAWTAGGASDSDIDWDGPFRDPVRPVQYLGDTRQLLTLLLRVTLLALVTASIYRFWGKTQVRQYLWRNIRLFGEPLIYTGTPNQLLLGTVVAVIVIGPALYLFYLVGDTDGGLVGLASVLASIGVYYVGRYAALRYRIRSTRWQAAFGSLGGSPFSYALASVAMLLVVAMTAGLLLPERNWTLYRYQITKMALGDQQFAVGHKPTGLTRVWVVCLILLVPTLGISFAYYKACEFTAFLGATGFSGRRVRAHFKTSDLIFVYWPYASLIVASGLLGFFEIHPEQLISVAGPAGEVLAYALSIAIALTVWTIIRVLVVHNLVRALADKLEIEGPVETIEIKPDRKTDPRIGEGILGVVDVGGL